MQLNKEHRDTLRTFQLKGLRKILRLKTTFIDRSNTNDKVFRLANEYYLQHNPSARPIRPLGDEYRERRIKLLAKTILLPETDTRRTIIFADNRLTLRKPVNRRQYGPRFQ
eukprot:9103968-Prorocentrum_lima.AAC.1